MIAPVGRPRSVVRRSVSALLLTAAAGIGLLGSGAHPAGASPPDRVGWWSEIEQLPLAVPVPGVPAGGFMVQEGPSGPSAYGAVHYRVAAHSDGMLSLPVSGTPLGTAALVACPVTSTWTATSGPGAWASRPSYGTSCQTGAVATDNSVVAFSIPADLTSSGDLDLAIVPAPSATPFSLDFDQPGTGSLTVTAPALPSVAPAVPEAPAKAAPVVPKTAETPTPVSSGSFYTPPAPIETTPAVTSTPAPVAPANPAPSVQLAAPAGQSLLPGDDRGTRTIAVLVLFGLLLAWWFVGGQPSRAPRLIGGVAAGAGTGVGGVAVSPALTGGLARLRLRGGGAGSAAVHVGGIGRFAKPRTGRPTRL